MQRRTVLVGALAALAGCASVDWDEVDTPDDDAPPVEGGREEYPHAIRAENVLDRPVSVTLAVEREGSTLYSGTHRVPPGTRAVIAGFTVESFPPDRRYVTVTASTADGDAASAGVSVTGCLGDVVVSVAGDGAASVTYSTCVDGHVRRSMA